MSARPQPFGVLLLDKPEGPTSHDLVGWVRYAMRVKQVGHCGTLDPAASGMLVVCVGAATRLVPFLTGVDKTYRARVVLGVETDSWDREGAVTGRRPADAALAARAADALPGMVGALELPPPVFSAVKVGGKRAHRMARKGEAVELKARPMIVRAVTDVAHGASDDCTAWVDATIEVSKGTYIRSLAVELGRRVGALAHLGALRRLSCGGVSLDGEHPVVPVSARLLPADGDRRARWRCSAEHRPEPLDGDAARELDGTALGEATVDPPALLPMAVVELGDSDGPSVAQLTRLGQGQTVVAREGLLAAALARHTAPTRVCLVGSERPRGPAGAAPSRVVIIAGVEPAEPAGTAFRVRPERVLRPGPRRGKPPQGA